MGGTEIDLALPANGISFVKAARSGREEREIAPMSRDFKHGPTGLRGKTHAALNLAGGGCVPHYGMCAISKPGIKVRDGVGGRQVKQ